jgi:hypothetical protein
MTAAERFPVAVCIIRVEAQADHVVITVTTHRDVDRNLYSAHAEPVERFSERDAALQAVARFLGTFR